MNPKSLRILGLAAVLAVASLASAQVSPSAGSFEAHTEPSKRSKVNFAFPGAVAQVLVKEGDSVKEGANLIKLDDRADVHALNALKLEGDSTLKVEAAKADLAQKKVELDRKLKGNENIPGTYSDLEVEEAKVAVLIREIQVQVEEMTRKQKSLEADRQAVKVDQMTLKAPFDGLVEKIELQLGETPDQQRAAVYVVKNDVLHINVDLPTSLALKLKLGDDLLVKYKDTGETVKGKVTFRSPVADAPSETLRIRLEVANSNGLPAGLVVQVFAPGANPTAVGEAGGKTGVSDPTGSASVR